jgi:phosphatidylglycerol lysyltransferase
MNRISWRPENSTLRWAALALVSLIVWRLAIFHSHARPMTLELNRGAFTVLDFPAKKLKTVAIVLFASGDGGWGSLEERICHALQKNGFEVIGIDSTAYARTDYDLATLQFDFSRMVQKAKAACGIHTLPLILGGYSMGAAQAIAAAGGPHPPPGLVGLVVVDPLSRGRYGLRAKDEMNVLPTGEGTFGMDDFAGTMGRLRVVQWHAEKDSIDSRAWLDKLTAAHREYDFPDAGHEYKKDREKFVRELVSSVQWLLSSPSTGKVEPAGTQNRS